MSRQNHCHIRDRGASGFTLIEVLVATAVLGLVMVLVLQVVNGVVQSTGARNQQMESAAAARRALDVMALDLQKAAVGENAAILVPATTGSSSLFALLAHRRPPVGQTARFLAVRYFTNANNELYRAYGSVADSATDLLAAAAGNATTINEPLASGILAVAVRAVASGTNSYAVTDAAAPNWAATTYNTYPAPSGYKALITTTPAFATTLANRTRALEIWMAAADAQTVALLNSSSKMGALTLALAPGNPAGWRAAVDAAAIPAQAKSAIRVLNKTVPLP